MKIKMIHITVTFIFRWSFSRERGQCVCVLAAIKPQEWLLLIDYSDEHANTEIRRLSPPHLKPQTTPLALEQGGWIMGCTVCSAGGSTFILAQLEEHNTEHLSKA